jgi:hypothetical protein
MAVQRTRVTWLESMARPGQLLRVQSGGRESAGAINVGRRISL